MCECHPTPVGAGDLKLLIVVQHYLEGCRKSTERVQEGMISKGSVKGPWRVCEGSVKGPGRVLEWAWNGPGWVPEGSWKGPGRVLEGSWKGSGRVLEGFWKGPGRVLEGSCNVSAVCYLAEWFSSITTSFNFNLSMEDWVFKLWYLSGGETKYSSPRIQIWNKH